MSTVVAKSLVFDGRGPQIFPGQNPDALPIFPNFKGTFTTKANIDGTYRVNNQFLLGGSELNVDILAYVAGDVLITTNRKEGAVGGKLELKVSAVINGDLTVLDETSGGLATKSIEIICAETCGIVICLKGSLNNLSFVSIIIKDDIVIASGFSSSNNQVKLSIDYEFIDTGRKIVVSYP